MEKCLRCEREAGVMVDVDRGRSKEWYKCGSCGFRFYKFIDSGKLKRSEAAADRELDSIRRMLDE